ncbi:glycosyltransferase family 4 protein [soil metagenome]
MKAPRRVALVHPFPWTEVRRGGERYLHDLAWYLSEQGHLVDVITSSLEPQGPVVDGTLSVRTLRRLGHPRLRAAGITPVETHGLSALVALVGRRYDVVHALTPSGALAGRLSGHPTVYSELGHPTAEDLQTRPVAWRLWRSATRGARAVTALSRSAKRAVDELSDGGPAVVLNPGTRLDRFRPDLAPRTGPPRLLFPADANQERKGVAVALAALGRLLRTHPTARLLLGGPGDHHWAVPRLGADAERILASVDVLGVGALDEIPDRYRQAAVTLLPSWHEAFGLVLTESLACGTPVVCTDAGGMPEIVDDPRIGRTFRQGDDADLARAITEAIALAADPETPALCARHARRWGWRERIGPEHEQLYERILRTRRRA